MRKSGQCDRSESGPPLSRTTTQWSRHGQEIEKDGWIFNNFQPKTRKRQLRLRDDAWALARFSSTRDMGTSGVKKKESIKASTAPSNSKMPHRIIDKKAIDFDLAHGRTCYGD